MYSAVQRLYRKYNAMETWKQAYKDAEGVREMETIITFEIAGEQYTMFVEGILKKKYYLSKENKGSVLADPILVKVTASTMKEAIMYWLECLQAYMRKKRFQKKSQSGRGCAGNCSRRNIG